jgi:predicted molibdopterin-dependent oxidoreductase YjgC
MSAGKVKLKVDGVEVECNEGATILAAAKAGGVTIPTLCDLEGLTPYGGCRLWVVEVSGTPRLFPACTTPAASGMDVTTKSPKLYEYRKMVLQTLLAERTHICAVCVAGVLTSRSERKLLAHLPGGDLQLEWAANNHVYKTGPAVEVFSGEWPD